MEHDHQNIQKLSKNTIQLTINDVIYTITDKLPPQISLNVFIRDHANLCGTKAMCHEGGCGACIVSAEIKDETLAVNSCLVPLRICNGWKIVTIEGLGNKKKGYHKIQAVLAEMNGSQCGFCSPGMVMNMYSLLQGKEITMKEVENSFGGNICRCTGYRPILDAFKGLASDAETSLAKKIHDIEELYKLKTCSKSGIVCNSKCKKLEDSSKIKEIYMNFDDAKFYKISSIESLFKIFTKNINSSYILNGGNTAHGVYRLLEKPEIYIDVNDISDLYRVKKENSSLILGGNVTLTTAKNTFIKFSKDQGFHHLRQMANHVDLIASVPVRNIGTLAGNLMIKHKHHEFSSDLFLMLEAAGAVLHILNSPMEKININLIDFLKINMKHKIIYSIIIPAIKSEHEYRSYKIMPRAQNSHAHVNAGFLVKLNARGILMEKPNIIFGGIKHDFFHAVTTENFLNGKCILDENVFKEAIKLLDSELKPDHILPDYSAKFRKILAEGLFYKFVLSLKPNLVDEKYRSGGNLLERSISSGKHDYDTDKNLWPVNKPLPKTESIYQTSGEAQYVNDLPSHPNDVFCAFVYTEYANGKIDHIDARNALEMKGVVAFLTAKDIPGKNLAIDSKNKEILLDYDEKLFVEKEIEYAGQPIGIIVACTHEIANEAVKKVIVKYIDVFKKKPIITFKDVIESNDKNRIFESANFPAKKKGSNIQQVIKGEFECGSQYHYTMETQSCVCIPSEDGIDVYPTSQWIDLTQVSIAGCLGIPNNRINIYVRRLGGGYGAKITRNIHISTACALASFILNRPARFVMSIESNMICIGKRFSARQEYNIGVDFNGVIQYLNSKNWHNGGATWNESIAANTIMSYYSCYNNDTWNCIGYQNKTDIPPNTYARAPGSTEGIAMIENIMEHISRVVKMDPVEVRLNNMNLIDKKILSTIIADLKISSNYETRVQDIKQFNNKNRWKKRGISLIPMKYPLEVWGQHNALVSIYGRDGTVSVIHGGIECGQGINTKVAQVAAHTLGIDLDMINVKPTNNISAPNNSMTGGSISSESSSLATMIACKEILSRLEPIKLKLNNPTWKELIFAAYEKNIDLSARYMLPNDPLKSYPIYGATVSEVELDILTGQHLIRRVDLFEDVGTSLNPDIDLGQIEGAFCMGIGYWTSEDLIYNPKTGILINNRTWNYKPPGAKDVPVDFRVSFRRNAPNPVGVLRSKATGEPPLCMSYSVLLAIRHALDSARDDAGNTDSWYQLDGPVTTEKILLTSLSTKNNMILKK